MQLRTLAAAAALTFAVAAPAFAAPVTVKLDRPVAERVKLVVGGSVFSCAGDACVATAAQARAVSPAACATFARQLGPVASYGGERRSLTADELARCNAAAPAATQVAEQTLGR